MKRNIFIVIAIFSQITFGMVAGSAPTDVSLDGLITYALEHNYDIQNAKEAIKEQEGLIVEIKASILPNASLVGDYTIKDEALIYGGVTPGSGADKNWGVSLEVSQLLYSGGGIRATLKAQEFSRESATHTLMYVIQQVMYQSRVAYYDALLAKKQILVEEKNVEYLKEQLKIAQDRFAVNTVSKLDVLRAEVEVANAHPALIRARNNYRLAVDKLYEIVGYQLDPSYEYNRSEVLGELAILPQGYDLGDCLRTAIESRPDLLQVQAVIKALEAGVDVAKAGFLPNVSLFGGYQYDKSPASGSFGDSLDGWNVGIRSSWSIFDGRYTRGKIMQANSKLRQAELDQRKLKLSVGVDVRRAISAIQEATELAEAAEKVVEQADEALRLARVRYEAGAATQVELLESTFSLTQAQTNQLSANYSYLVAQAQLTLAMGQ